MNFIKKYSMLVIIGGLLFSIYTQNQLRLEYKKELFEMSQNLQNMGTSIINLNVKIVQLEQKISEKTDFNDISASIYCCGSTFYSYDSSTNMTQITPTKIPIKFMIEGKIPDYITFTQEERDHFTFFYINGNEYYPIMSYLMISEYSAKDSTYEYQSLGDGFVVVEVNPNVPANIYTQDEKIIEAMKTFMSKVTYIVLN